MITLLIVFKFSFFHVDYKLLILLGNPKYIDYKLDFLLICYLTRNLH